MTTSAVVGSASIEKPNYWWYRARADLLETVLGEFVGNPDRLLDVGSADGPSVGWLKTTGQQIALDLDPRGLGPGGVCGSALALPFASGSFDVVAAFDVVEHCAPESVAIAELVRVLRPGGRLLLSLPAYNWAWTSFDDDNGHLRRYTRPRAVAALAGTGMTVERATYAFTSTFPMFAGERLTRRAVGKVRGPRPEAADGAVPPLPEVPAALEKVLMGLTRMDRRLLRRRDLPFGSSVIVAATKR